MSRFEAWLVRWIWPLAITGVVLAWWGAYELAVWVFR